MRTCALCGLALVAALIVAAPASAGIKIDVLSSRADLVSGGDAIVAIKAKRVSKLTIRLNRRNVSKRFKKRADGRRIGRVKRLKDGRNVLRAVRKNGRGARLVIRNHPNGGPVFSGPQLQPWECQEEAVDEQCNQPPEYTYLYKPEDATSELAPYDPKNPPDDVATTTTDEGVEVPFIVRQELGYQDRDQYKILTLFDPGKKWRRWTPQEQWNHKLLITHGGGCGGDYGTSGARLDDYSGTIPPTPGYSQSYVTALGRGFAVGATALNNNGHNCNLVTPGRVDADDEGAPGRALRRPALHDRHRLLGRLDHPAAGRERVPRRRLRRPGRDLRVPGQPVDRRAVRRLPPAAHLLRGLVALGPGRRLDAVAVGRRRGHGPTPSTRSPPTSSSSRTRRTRRATACRPRSSTTARRTRAACAARCSTT